jgi:simple sugar transport system permease protein
MLNTVAYGLSSWMVLQFFRNTESQNPESAPIAEALRFVPWDFFQGAPISWHVLLVPIFGLLVYVFYRWSRVGFALTWVASAPGAAEHAGFSLRRLEFWALALGGLLAGAIGIAEVFGNTGRYVVGFSPGYGFLGIAVALLGRLHPLGIILASFVFGALYKGSLELDFETQEITKDFALILQAVIILFLSCDSLIPERWRKKLERKEAR